MLLAIDIGNTNIVLGLFEEEVLCEEWRISTDMEKSRDEYWILLYSLCCSKGIDRNKIKGIIISSVVPSLTPEFKAVGEKYFNLSPLIVSPELDTGIVIRYLDPKEVGQDRIVNAASAYKIYGGPVIIVDFGTATTFCVVSKNGEYIGGAISPGVMASAKALSSKAERLPEIKLIRPENILGRDTVTSMQSGIIFGYASLVDGMVKRIKNELKEEKINVIATGGLSQLIAKECTTIKEIRPLLTLEGLRIIYERNMTHSPHGRRNKPENHL
ncbi:MAG: type III pantothenate kinase [Nitrospirota bacterium]